MSLLASSTCNMHASVGVSFAQSCSSAAVSRKAENPEPLTETLNPKHVVLLCGPGASGASSERASDGLASELREVFPAFLEYLS